MWGRCENKMSPAGAAHCGLRYWCEMRGTSVPHTMGPTVVPSGAHTAHLGPLGYVAGPQWASVGPTLSLHFGLGVGCPTGAPPGPHSVGPTCAPHFTPVTRPTVGCPCGAHFSSLSHPTQPPKGYVAGIRVRKTFKRPSADKNF